MPRSNTRTALILFALCFLLPSTFVGASALQVNETVKGFRISFDAIDDTNMVAKFWSNGSSFFGDTLRGPLNELANGAGVMAGNGSDPYKRWGACLIFVLKNPENTSNIERNMTKNNTNKYIRVYDRMVDGHKGLLLKEGNESSDALMNYEAMYWLDESRGKATKFVYVVSGWPDKETEKLLNTIHVEEITPGPVKNQEDDGMGRGTD
jgi:hypothetical protein